MPNYEKMYYKLAVAVSNSIENMQKAMQEAEEIYISSEELEIAKIKEDEENAK